MSPRVRADTDEYSNLSFTHRQTDRNFHHSRLGADLSFHSRPFQLRPATTRRAFTTRATATESGSKSDEIVGMPVVLIDNRSDPLATVVSVQFSDVLGQLLDTVESLKALGLNVSRAEVTQDENPNKFYVTDAATSEKVVKSEQIENIRMAVINNMIAYHPESKQYFEGASASFGSFDVDANPLGARPPSKVKTKVAIKAMGSSRSKLTVETADRPGLLVDVVRTLKDLSLNVVSAEIDTIGPKAVDEVYLTYRCGALNSSMNELVVNALTYYLSKKEVETDESY